MPGIFAGGDVTTGPATVIKAVAAGRSTAECMEQYMSGASASAAAEAEDKQWKPCQLHACADGCHSCTKATLPRTLPTAQRGLDVEDTAGFTEDEMNREAARCMDCGCLAVNPSDMANILIALNATVKTTRRTMSLEELLTADPMVEKTLKPGELLLEIVVPKPAPGTVVKYQKFRLRNSIDFAVAAAASSYTIRDYVIMDARLVFGAVAPVPMRMRDVEAFLIGKHADAKTAQEAADLALKDAHPLAQNEYKIDIVKTLVKRSFEG